MVIEDIKRLIRTSKKCCQKTTTETVEGDYDGEVVVNFPANVTGSVHIVKYNDKVVFYVKGAETWDETISFDIPVI